MRVKRSQQLLTLAAMGSSIFAEAPQIRASCYRVMVFRRSPRRRAIQKDLIQIYRFPRSFRRAPRTLESRRASNRTDRRGCMKDRHGDRAGMATVATKRNGFRRTEADIDTRLVVPWYAECSFHKLRAITLHAVIYDA
mmetsp:Transcript_13342/g.21922  ORF Transcript_13342/g.21922 Transcript_13342/m.21922 type:complete len:138 (+) Transcript_13342:1169-1582(+)